MLVYYASLRSLFLWGTKGGSEEGKDALPKLLLAPKHPRCLPHWPGLDWQARKIAPGGLLAALLPVELHAGKTHHVPGRGSWDLQGAQGKSGACHPRRIRRGNSTVSQGSFKTKHPDHTTPALPLAQIRQLWSKKQMSSLITQAFFACGSSRVCSVSVLLQLSLRPCSRGKAQLLGRREAHTSHRLSPAKRYGSDGS